MTKIAICSETTWLPRLLSPQKCIVAFHVHLYHLIHLIRNWQLISETKKTSSTSWVLKFTFYWSKANISQISNNNKCGDNKQCSGQVHCHYYPILDNICFDSDRYSHSPTANNNRCVLSCCGVAVHCVHCGLTHQSDWWNQIREWWDPDRAFQSCFIFFGVPARCCNWLYWMVLLFCSYYCSPAAVLMSLHPVITILYSLPSGSEFVSELHSLKALL